LPALIDQYGRELPPVEKAAVPAMRPSDIVGDGGWWPIIREPFAGAWQRNLEVRADTVVSNVTVFRCVSLIASDIAKMRLKLIQQVSPGVWEEADNPAWSPVIRKPNHFQNRIQFFENC
jgi:phage portal protein BeeE